MRVARSLAALFLLAGSFASINGCSGGAKDGDEASDSTADGGIDPMDVEARYQADIKEVSDGWDACIAAGACNASGLIAMQADAGGEKKGRVIGPVARPDGLISGAGALLSAIPSTFCKAAQGLTSQDLNNLWWFMGNSVSGSLPIPVLNHILPVGGMDLAYDMWNAQGAGFVYAGGSATGSSNGFGITASAYEGFASGSKMGVIDGWSGTFVTGSVGVSTAVLKLLGVGASLSYFCDPEKTICGAGLSADISVSSRITLGSPVSASISGSVGQWYPYDTLTTDLSQAPWYGWHFSATLAGAANQKYVQFNDGKSLAYGILGSAGLSSPIAVALAVGVQALKASGGTVDSYCKSMDGGVSEGGATKLVGP